MRPIDADAIPYVMRFMPDVGDMDYVRKYKIDEMPTLDAVPVVRCKYCKHRYYYKEEHIAPICTASMAYVSTADDWFCKDGERKDDE